MCMFRTLLSPPALDHAFNHAPSVDQGTNPSGVFTWPGHKSRSISAQQWAGRGAHVQEEECSLPLREVSVKRRRNLIPGWVVGGMAGAGAEAGGGADGGGVAFTSASI